ncbi:MAG: DUF58 domain-containing protein [Mucilaginibacter polytrichastri]|nr:DUF58 domain-containing protein [Mucilaginibacter polytrichastri]
MRTWVFRLYFSPLFYTFFAVCVGLFILAFFFPVLSGITRIITLAGFALTAIDYVLLMRVREPVFARRTSTDRLSNGDENPVELFFENRCTFPLRLQVVDEVPFQFQLRDVDFRLRLSANEQKSILYHLRPVRRGNYDFGYIQTFLRSPLGLVVRKYSAGKPVVLPVYPSFLQMRRYELLAISNRLTEAGIKKIRRIGHSMEFDQIKPYVQGDDYRSVNWKASARRDELMVNAYTDERSQQVYCVIDKSRTMQSPFEGLSLLDYAINASLVLANVAMLKQDKAGLITIAEKDPSVLGADRGPQQLNRILQILYKERTRYPELNGELLFSTIKKAVKQRSLVVFFTNFETINALHRQLPYLRSIARQHLLLVVFFENTELRSLTESAAKNVEDIYVKTVAGKFAYEKKLIVKEFQRYNIMSILTAPQHLTVNTVNKYLELKARQRI